MTDATAYTAADDSCPGCASHRIKSLLASASDAAGQHVSIRECRACGLAWQYPVGRSEQASVTYFETAYDDAGQQVSDYFSPTRKAQIADVQQAFVNSLGLTRGALLEVGAGAGFFAAAAAHAGWQVTALDPALSVAPCLDLSGVRLLRGTPAQIAPDDRFDVITLWDVVEHLPEPAAAIKDLRRHLAPGGWLIVETGNYCCIDRVEEGTDHWIYQLDHRWYFSPATLADLLRRQGFTRQRLAPNALRPDWRGPADYAGPSLRTLLRALRRRPWRAAHLLLRYFRLRRVRRWRHARVHVFAIAAQMGG